MQQEEALQRVRGRATLVLDTTYLLASVPLPSPAAGTSLQAELPCCYCCTYIEWPGSLSGQQVLLAVLRCERLLRVAAPGDGLQMVCRVWTLALA